MHLIISEHFKTPDEFQDFINQKLEFPDYYGHNLDALWDCLTGYVDMPLKIEWRSFSSFRNNNEEYAAALLKLFKDAKNELDGFEFKHN